MKVFYTTVFSIFICIGTFAQKLTYTPHQDSLWVAKLFGKLKEEEKKANEKILQRDRELREGDLISIGEWISSKVIYSPDSFLRIAQIMGVLPHRAIPYSEKIDSIYFFDVTVQYLYKNKIIEQNLPSENDIFYFQNYPIREIHKLPDSTKQAYLIISSNKEEGDEQATNVASAIVLGTDSLKEIPFLRIPEVYYYPPEYEEIEKGGSIEVNNSIDKKGNTPIKYDSINNEIHFINSHCVEYDMNGKCDRPYINFYIGVFEYTDTAFVLRYDSIYYNPPLESLKKTIATKTYKISDYTIKASAVQTYEEVGMGVLPVITTKYTIGKDTISEVAHDATGGEDINLTPNYKLQKDGSLIILTTNITFPNHSGECGMCENDDLEFWLVKKGSIKKLFSFSYNAGAPYVARSSYEYNIGKTTQTGGFYLKSSNLIEEEEQEAVIEEAYWKNNSTYVVRVSNEKWFRNFYIHFDSLNNVAKIEEGELLKEIP